MLCNWGCISYVKSRAMALNLVEYKSPVQNVIAYARIACLLLTLPSVAPKFVNCFSSVQLSLLKKLDHYLGASIDALFFGLFRNCLNCDSLRWSHTHFICIPAVHIISICVSFLSPVDELNKLAGLQCMGLHSSAGRVLQR